MTENERIKLIVKTLVSYGIGKNQEEIGKLMGFTNKSAFSQVLNGKVPISKDFVDKLCKLDNRISKKWILFEAGNPFIENNKQVYNEDSETLQKVEVETNINDKTSIPFVSVTAIGGFGNKNFAIQESDIKEYYVIPKFKHKKIDFMIEVEGSSMYPKYNSGDVVACTIIKESSFIQWNKTHVIATKEQGIIIKRLKKSEIENNLIMLSDNSSYEPFEVSKKDILGIALVVGVIRLE
jgi:repressor LexA